MHHRGARRLAAMRNAWRLTESARAGQAQEEHDRVVDEGRGVSELNGAITATAPIAPRSHAGYRTPATRRRAGAAASACCFVARAVPSAMHGEAGSATVDRERPWPRGRRTSAARPTRDRPGRGERDGQEREQNRKTGR